jgi:hypothetical protein
VKQLDREKVIKGLEHCISADETCAGCPYEGTTCTTTLNADALALIKEQGAVPNELKLKMWNALYAKEDEYEKKLVGTDKHHEWFSTYRPWLQMGFNIAIDAIAEWEGR